MLAAQRRVKMWANVSPLRRPWIKASARRFAAARPAGTGMLAIVIYGIPLLLEEGIKGWCADHPRPLLNQEGSTDIPNLLDL
jgi:hypothetical protein